MLALMGWHMTFYVHKFLVHITLRGDVHLLNLRSKSPSA